MILVGAFQQREEAGALVGFGCLPKILHNGLMAMGQQRVRK